MRRRFTLIEMILAAGLLAVVMCVAAMALRSAQQTWQSVDGAKLRMERLLAVDSIAENAFRNTVNFTWFDGVHKERLCFDGQPDTVMFPYLHRVTTREEGALRFIRLYLEDGNLTAAYRPYPMLADDDVKKCEIETLAGEVKAVSFRYAFTEDDKLVWFDRWDNDKLRNVPSAIEMTVTFTDGGEFRWLRRTAGNSWRMRPRNSREVVK